MSLVTEALHRITKVVHSAPALADVSVEALGEGDWRVSLPEGGAFAMLGLITSEGSGRYQVIRVSQPLDDIVKPSFQEAVDALRPRAVDVPAILAGVRV